MNSEMSPPINSIIHRRGSSSLKTDCRGIGHRVRRKIDRLNEM